MFVEGCQLRLQSYEAAMFVTPLSFKAEKNKKAFQKQQAKNGKRGCNIKELYIAIYTPPSGLTLIDA